MKYWYFSELSCDKKNLKWIFISYGIYETRCVFYIPSPKARGYKTHNLFHKYRMKWKFISDLIYVQMFASFFVWFLNFKISFLIKLHVHKLSKLIYFKRQLTHMSSTRVHLSTMSHFLTDWPGWPFRKRGRGRWDLASCQVSLNSVKRFKRSRKCISQSEARAAILFIQSVRKTQIWSGADPGIFVRGDPTSRKKNLKSK